MANYKKEQYHIALNSQGYLLNHTPVIGMSPSRTMQQAPVFGTRFAQGDRTYEDFTFWWYWRQSDWSGGFKNEVSWKDDAKYYSSTNIDTFSKVGSVQLASLATGDGLTTNEAILCGHYGDLGGTLCRIVGTDVSATGSLYYATGTSWSNLGGTGITSQVFQVKSHKTKVFLSTVQTSANALAVYSLATAGATFSDCMTGASGITAVMGWGTGASGPYASYTTTEIGNTLYAGVDNVTNSKCGVAQTTDAGTSWTKTLEYNGQHQIVSSIGYNGDLYYLTRLITSGSSPLELRYYDISASTDNSLYTFYCASTITSGVSDKFLHVLGSKLIITVPESATGKNSIWSYDASTGELKKILFYDSTKLGGTLPRERSWGINRGGVLHNDKIYWGNLVYDGQYFYNYTKDNTDYTEDYHFPLFSGMVSNLSCLHSISNGNSYKTLLREGSLYKGTADKNFLVFNQMDTTPTIDKLYYTCTINFETLVSGQKISIEYSLVDDIFSTVANWTALGNASFSIDGGVVSSKTFSFPSNTVVKKMWFRVKLEGGGSNTPALNDISVAFYPIPDYKQRWNLRLQCFDNALLLDGKTRETKRGIELRNLLKFAWLNKQTVEFQDIDFAETSLSAQATGGATGISVYDTSAFPEQGIVKVEQEKIKYTAKTAIQLSSCTRGFDGTVAATHASGTTINNAHQVILYDYNEQCTTGAKPKVEEFVVELGMMEI